MEKLTSILEFISLVVTVLGIPVAIFLFFTEKKKERLAREYETYNALDDKYLEFLQLCMANTDLGIYEMADKELNEEQSIRREILMETLTCLFERAFLMYQGQDNHIRAQQWSGWEAYIQDWMSNKTFRKEWSGSLNSQYDSRFLEYMNRVYESRGDNTGN